MRLGMALGSVLLIAACSAGGSNSGTLAPSAAGPSLTTSEPSSPAADVPPAGQLASDGESVTAFQGTYCWNGTCADVFDTPPAADLPLVQASGADLTFSLADAAQFIRWSAAYRADDADELTPLAQGGADYDPDTVSTLPPALTTADFDAPPSGDWVLIVQAFFAEGDAQYMWHVVVE